MAVYLSKMAATMIGTTPPCAKWISTVGKRLYVNALTESERLNDTEYRSEAKLIAVRP